MGLHFTRKRQHPDKWAPTKQELVNAEKIVFQQQRSLALERQQKQNKADTINNDSKEALKKRKRMWRSSVDPTNNRVYYYHIRTRERSYTKPEEILQYEQSLFNSQGGELELNRRDWILQADNRTLNTVVTLDGQGALSGETEPAQDVEVLDLTSLTLEEFFRNSRANASECLTEVYEMDYTVDKSLVSGRLSIALPQDIFHLVETQLSLLDEYLEKCDLQRTKVGDKLVADLLLSILRNISSKQRRYKDRFLQDSINSCVAAANSFLWMVDKVDELMQNLAERYPHLRWSHKNPTTWMVCQEAKQLVAQLGEDAVAAASDDAVLFIIEDLYDAGISDMLFSHQWEEDLVHNEVAISMTRVFENYMCRLSTWFDSDFLYHKMVRALARATICFYVEEFVGKARKLRKMSKGLGKKAAKQKAAFRNSSKAVVRISHDIKVLRDYYQDISSGNTALGRVVSKEFLFLELLEECMMNAVNHSTMQNLEGFVIPIHKETGLDADVTRHFMSDLWLLMGPKGHHLAVEECVNTMHVELECFTLEDAKGGSSGFCVDKVLKMLYKDRIRSEQSIISIAEGALKKKQGTIKREFKSSLKNAKYFFEDLEDRLPGKGITAAEF